MHTTVPIYCVPLRPDLHAVASTIAVPHGHDLCRVQPFRHSPPQFLDRTELPGNRSIKCAADAEPIAE